MAVADITKSTGNKNPTFTVQIADDNGKITEYKNIKVSCNFVSQKNENLVKQYIKNNASSLSQEELATNVQAIIDEQYNKEVSQPAGTYEQNGMINTYVSNDASLWEKAKIAGAQLLGLPVDTSTLSGVKLISSSPSKSNTQTSEKRIDPYSEIAGRNNINQTLALKDVIGGSDLSVFFLFEFDDPDPINKKLPVDARKKDFIMVEMDNVLSLTYSIMREKTPVRAIGHINPLDILPGIRSISGSIAFAIYTDDVLAYLRGLLSDKMENINNKFKEYKAYIDKQEAESAKKTGNSTPTVFTTQQAKAEYEQKKKEWESYNKQYSIYSRMADRVQLLDAFDLFDILVMGVNENGSWSRILLKDVSIIDENQYQGTQQPNIVNKVTFTCKDIVPMAKFKNYKTLIASLDSVSESYSDGSYHTQFNYRYDITGSGIVDEITNSINKDNTVVDSDDL